MSEKTNRRPLPVEIKNGAILAATTFAMGWLSGWGLTSWLAGWYQVIFGAAISIATVFVAIRGYVQSGGRL
jgi:hypothetical protein